MKKTDEQLGMNANITRRDVLEGLCLASAGICFSPEIFSVDYKNKDRNHPHLEAENYPPLRTGLRGSHEGSFEVAHAIRNEEQCQRRFE